MSEDNSLKTYHPTKEDEIQRMDDKAAKEKVSKDTLWLLRQINAQRKRVSEEFVKARSAVRREFQTLRGTDLRAIKGSVKKAMEEIAKARQSFREGFKALGDLRESDLRASKISDKKAMDEISKLRSLLRTKLSDLEAFRASESKSLKTSMQKASGDAYKVHLSLKTSLKDLEKKRLAFALLFKRHQANYNRIQRVARQYQLRGVKMNKVYETVGGSATEEITMPGLKASQACAVSLHTKGSPARTIVESRCEEDKLVVVFDDDPGTDHKINYLIT